MHSASLRASLERYCQPSAFEVAGISMRGLGDWYYYSKNGIDDFSLLFLIYFGWIVCWTFEKILRHLVCQVMELGVAEKWRATTAVWLTQF